jgi:hypothetical protein
LELQSFDEENASQQVGFVKEDKEDDDELFEVSKSKKSSWGIKRKWDLLKTFSVKNPRYVYFLNLSVNGWMRKSSSLYLILRRRKLPPEMAATLCARKWVLLYRLVQAYDSNLELWFVMLDD